MISVWIEAICGPMFSGKKSELMRRLRRAIIARKRVQVFKPLIDQRYSDDEIVSHNDLRMKSQVIEQASEIFPNLDTRTEVVGVDEANFFRPDLVNVAARLADSGKQVLIAGLDTDYMGRPFPPMPDLLTLAESIAKTLAICVRCGNPAKHTQRLVESSDLIVVALAECTKLAAVDASSRACRSRLIWNSCRASPNSNLAVTCAQRGPSKRLYNCYSTDQRTHVHLSQSQPRLRFRTALHAAAIRAASRSATLYAPPPQQYYAPPPLLREQGFRCDDWHSFRDRCGLDRRQCLYLHAVGQGEEGTGHCQRLDASASGKLEEAASLSTQSNRRTVDQLRDQLERARRQANLAAGQAKDEALKKVDETRAALEAAQEQAKQQLSSDISKVKESADTQFSQVGNEVTSVKGDVAATKSQLEKTVAELKHATGELDGHSVLIATNGKELQALQALGERNYVQFTIQKAKQPQKVGDISIQLKRTDPKKNRYTIDLTADDKTVEKKDRVPTSRCSS